MESNQGSPVDTELWLRDGQLSFRLVKGLKEISNGLMGNNDGKFFYGI